MSRSGYIDDYDDTGRAGLYRANVIRAILGKRGQAFLREMAAALDAMSVRELVADEVVRDSEHVCAMGSVALARKLDVSDLDVEDAMSIGSTFGIAEALAREIAYENDECGPWKETPAQRWARMRRWVADQLKTEALEAARKGRTR
jgi:hypothetical protein